VGDLNSPVFYQVNCHVHVNLAVQPSCNVQRGSLLRQPEHSANVLEDYTRCI